MSSRKSLRLPVLYFLRLPFHDATQARSDKNTYNHGREPWNTWTKCTKPLILTSSLHYTILVILRSFTANGIIPIAVNILWEERGHRIPVWQDQHLFCKCLYMNLLQMCIFADGFAKCPKRFRVRVQF